MSKHVLQLHKEILQISEDCLGAKICVVDLNKNFDHTRMQANCKTFHEDPDRVGVLTLNKDTKSWFSQVNQNGVLNTPTSSKSTVFVYWRTWVHYGSFTYIHKTLKTFFEKYRDTDPQAPLGCAICLEEHDRLQIQGVFACDHMFCRLCVAKYIVATADPVCPLCRKKKLL